MVLTLVVVDGLAQLLLAARAQGEQVEAVGGGDESLHLHKRRHGGDELLAVDKAQDLGVS